MYEPTRGSRGGREALMRIEATALGSETWLGRAWQAPGRRRRCYAEPWRYRLGYPMMSPLLSPYLDIPRDPGSPHSVGNLSHLGMTVESPWYSRNESSPSTTRKAKHGSPRRVSCQPTGIGGQPRGSCFLAQVRPTPSCSRAAGSRTSGSSFAHVISQHQTLAE